MSRDIQQLLQECLDGYDAGLTPEQCLSAYPRQRAELEPLFRQALSLRVAYATSPSREFQARARERLLIAAGRDVKAAFSSAPDPRFVENTRRRLLNTAGAETQEALRDVPPPRLPFWANARRRLLETASIGPPRPSRALSAGLRSALSAAVVVLAVAVAGGAFFLSNSPANEPPRSAALVELESIAEQLRNIEARQANGEPVSSILLGDLAERTKGLAEQNAANADPEVVDKLPNLIARQLELAQVTPLDDSVAQAQERLAEADQVTSAVAADLEPTNTSEPPVVAIETSEPTTEPTQEPTATPEFSLPVTVLEPSDLVEGQIAIQLDADETALDLQWLRVTTSTLTFVMPSTWEVVRVEVDNNGLAVLPAPLIRVRTDLGFDQLIPTETAEVLTLVDGQQSTLRSEGADGTVIGPLQLAEIVGPDQDIGPLYHMLTSLQVVEPDATQTPAGGTATPAIPGTPGEGTETP
jgi:hypothetical protein